MYAETSDPFWLDESRRNVVRGIFWVAAPVASAALSIARRSWLPIGLFALGAAAIGARTAIRACRRTRSPRLLAAYALHSHLQQVPILLGQLHFWCQRRGGRRGGIMEYRTP